MTDPRGFLKFGRQGAQRRPVGLRILDWKEVYEPLDSDLIKQQATRCMDCGIPFCHHGCPLGNLIPEWNDLTGQDDMQEAIERLHATNNFPEFTGRLCPAPCEAACTLGINDNPVSIELIEKAIIETAFAQGRVEPVIAQHHSGKTVAIVGSGPAGLAASQQLARAGHEVTVFERSSAIGGLLRFGIPEFKMEKEILDRRLSQLTSEGVAFRTGVTIGASISLEELVQSFDAVVLALGSTTPRDLAIDGRSAQGIYQAMEFLPLANEVALGQLAHHPYSARDKRVVIIGGGDTGADCLGTVHRQGARAVTQIEIMERPPEQRPDTTPWPTWPLIYRTSSAHEEGGEREFAIATSAFLYDDRNHVTGIRTERVQVTTEGGRPTFRSVAGSEKIIETDLVLLALGFTGPELTLLDPDKTLERTAHDTILVDNSWMTSIPGVFATGDCRRGQSLIVWAIAEGRSTAASVDRYLMGRSDLPEPIQPTTAALRVS